LDRAYLMSRAERRRQQKLALKAAKKGAQAPHSLPALGQQALQHLKSGRLQDAEHLYLQILQVDPNHPVALHFLGLIAFQTQRNAAAIDLITKAISITPDYAEAHSNLGMVFHKLGRLDDAEKCFHKALTLKPDLVVAYNNLGNIFQEQGRLDEAVASFHKALALNPNYAEAYNNLGNTVKGLGKFDEAVDLITNALTLNPRYAEAHNNLGMALIALGQQEETLACYQQALAIAPDFTKAYSNFLLALNYQPKITAQNIYQEHEKWGLHNKALLGEPCFDHNNNRNPNKRLRIGLVSGDLCRHPVGIFLLGLLENRNSDETEFFCYSDSAQDDDLSDRLKQLSAGWLKCMGTTDESLAQHIYADQIDILFDLAGHTGKNRMFMFAKKPAPVQVTWAGYVGTTGLKTMDYLLSDVHYTPTQDSPDYFEKIINMPDAYVCYSPPTDIHDVASLPCHENGGITFGSLNNVSKINEDVLSTWTDILKAVPNSKLFLKYKGMDCASNVERITAHFNKRGIDASRLIVEGGSPQQDFIASYNKVDIALDTFPYSGGLTTLEALWMGTPVITVPGVTFASRHSLSYLSVLGHTEWVAKDTKGYIKLAVDLAGNIPHLTHVSSELREKMRQSPICDCPKFAKNFTLEMQKIWLSWCSKNHDK